MAKSIRSKREKEKSVLELMISIYCRNKHQGKQVCPKCKLLLDYAIRRVERCPFMETKTFCSNCKIHCYKEDMREEIRKVMAYAGPWMLVHHPIMAIGHVMESRKERKQI